MKSAGFWKRFWEQGQRSQVGSSEKHWNMCEHGDALKAFSLIMSIVTIDHCNTLLRTPTSSCRRTRIIGDSSYDFSKLSKSNSHSEIFVLLELVADVASRLR